ncbi:MAG: DsbA family protein [Candidatus Gottesmanbacteria bacterium]|nr:DsbA family protein [Candidatus Gottesmanbacteria bacterium]
MEKLSKRHEAHLEQPTIVIQQIGGVIQAVVIILLIVCSFLLGSLWTKVQILERGGVSAVSPIVAGQPTTAGAGGQAVLPPTQDAKDVPKVTKDDHVRGDRNARIALVEYSDIECPFCKRFHPTAQQVVDAYKGKVMWVYRHYPLAFHANAQKEAEASECANELGGNDAFWKYLDAVYDRTTSNGTGFALDKLVPIAVEIGLNEAKFKGCLDSGRYASHVKDDMNGGSKAGVTGTPGNILLDTKTGKTNLIPGAVPFETMKAAIDEMLK